MKTHSLLGTLALFAAATVLAGPQDDVKSAAKKLADATGYSWKATTQIGGGTGGGGAGGSGNRMTPAPVEGKAAKDGTLCIKMVRGENTTEGVLKGEKGAIKTADGWKSLAELAEANTGGGGGGQRNPGGFAARMLRNYKAPAVEAADLAGKTKELRKDGDALVGQLTEEGAKSLMTFGRGGANAPTINEAKGSVKFWLKDGLLAKYEYSVQGKMTTRDGNERDVDRTTKIEISSVGTTQVDVPEDAKKKLS